MKLISKQEYDSLITFMRPKLKSLWEHENQERAKHNKNQINVFQFGFSILDIFHHKIDEKYDFYLIFNGNFFNMINQYQKPKRNILINLE